MADTQRPMLHNATEIARSRLFNIDNGAGATVDDCIMKHSKAVRILTARFVYSTETTGTVAAGNVKLGTTVGGAEIAAAAAYENSKAIGVSTSIPLTLNEIPAGTPIIARHTGVASVAAGEGYVEIEYAVHE